MKKINVQGMHCDACKKIIMMELEDAGLDSSVDNVEIFGEENRGIFHFKEGIDGEHIEKFKNIINSMEGYSTE